MNDSDDESKIEERGEADTVERCTGNEGEEEGGRQILMTWKEEEEAQNDDGKGNKLPWEGSGMSRKEGG